MGGVLFVCVHVYVCLCICKRSQNVHELPRECPPSVLHFPVTLGPRGLLRLAGVHEARCFLHACVGF